MANDLEQRLALSEAELSAYRDENDRLAKELVLARRVIEALPFTMAAEPGGRGSALRRLPRVAPSGADVVFSVDRCECVNRLVQIVGWAFCPRIDCGDASVSILLESPEETFVIHTQSVLRADVAAAHEKVEYGPSLPLGSPARARLDRSGFSVLFERAQLAPGRKYTVAIQIDGPSISVRKATASVLTGG